MNSNKLPPIVQESIFSNNRLDNTDDISFHSGMMIFNSSMPDFIQTNLPTKQTIERNCGTSSKPYRINRKMNIVPGRVNTNAHKQS